MLTFFEYLRQRAFESIVVGVQEALDSLEREPFKGQLNATVNPPGHAAPLNLQGQATGSQEAGETQLALVSTAPDSLPPPRRRGRPPKSDRPS